MVYTLPLLPPTHGAWDLPRSYIRLSYFFMAEVISSLKLAELLVLVWKKLLDYMAILQYFIYKHSLTTLSRPVLYLLGYVLQILTDNSTRNVYWFVPQVSLSLCLLSPLMCQEKTLRVCIVIRTLHRDQTELSQKSMMGFVRLQLD